MSIRFGNKEVVVNHEESRFDEMMGAKAKPEGMGVGKKVRQHVVGILPRNLALMKVVKRSLVPFMLCKNKALRFFSY